MGYSQLGYSKAPVQAIASDVPQFELCKRLDMGGGKRRVSKTKIRRPHFASEIFVDGGFLSDGVDHTSSISSRGLLPTFFLFSF